MAERTQNPFDVPVVQEEGDRTPDPFAVLRAVSAPTETSAAKQITEALAPTPKDGPDPEEADKKNFLQNAFQGQFKKGPMAGMDKGVFFAMLADTLTSISTRGEAKPKFTRMSLAKQAQRQEIEARQAEMASREALERELQNNRLVADAENTDKSIKAGEAEQKFRISLEELKINAETKSWNRKQEAAKGVFELESKVGLRAQLVSEVFGGIDQLDDVVLPEGMTPEAAFDDPAMLERARNLLAPAKQRNILKQIEREQGAKQAKDASESLGRIRQRKSLWLTGMRPVTENEAALGVNEPFVPIKGPDGVPLGSVEDQIAMAIQTEGVSELMNPQKREFFIAKLVRDAAHDYIQNVVGSEPLDSALVQQGVTSVKVTAEVIAKAEFRNMLSRELERINALEKADPRDRRLLDKIREMPAALRPIMLESLGASGTGPA